MIKAVIFDFDDTLGNREVYAYDCWRAILKELTDIEDPFEFEAILQDVMLWDEKGNITKAHVKNRLKSVYGIELPCEDPDKYWDSRLWRYCVPLEGAEETLEELSSRYILGLLTNGPSDGQRNKLRQSGLSRFFTEDRITVSGDYPFGKPDKRIFLAAAEKLGVKPEECVYVGDIYARDVLGAHRSGMTPVWIWNRGERKCGTDIIIIHKISELLNYF